MSALDHLGSWLGASFEPGTVARARSYAADGAVHSPSSRELGAHGLEAYAMVRGSHRSFYAVHLHAGGEGEVGEIDTSCTCPVGYQCKHGAALALVLARTAPRTRDWRDDLADVLRAVDGLPDPGAERPGVALQVSASAPRARYPGSSPAAHLHLRPLRLGARQRWVKAGLGWSDVPAALARGEHDLEQLRVLDRMRIARTRDSSWSGGPEAALEELGPGALDLLREAVDAGVTLVPVAPLRELVVLDEPVRLGVDATLGDAGAALRVGVQHDGRTWHGDELTTYGDPAYVVSLGSLESMETPEPPGSPDPAGATDVPGRLVLARVEPPLSGMVLRTLRRGDPLVVPAEGLGELPGTLDRIRSRVPVVSSDGSVDVPVAHPPRLRVTVTWATASRAEVAWQWRYGEHPAFDLDAAAPGAVVRDHAGERALLGRVAPRPARARTIVEGVDVLHLALLELAAWRAVDGLEVVEVSPPDFRETSAPVELAFVQPDDDGSDEPPAGHTDWLDLEVQVVVEGERLLLVDLLAALTRGDEHVVLPSGLFVRTDRPEFARLARTVAHAAELRERRDDRPDDDRRLRVSRDDLGTWAELADLGTVDAAAAQWVARARALRDLTGLPDPDLGGVVSTLRPYQLDGVRWLTLLWEHDLGGILADDMGLGKTLQVLSLVAHARRREPGGAPFLVVAPTSVVPAWAREAERHTPGLRVRTVGASQSRRSGSIADLAADADVLVTTYTLLRLEADAYAALPWSGLVLDEAQQVKNAASKAHAAVRSISAPFRLAVTGTPFENRLLELWSLLAITCPGLYPTARGFVAQVVTPVEKEGDVEALGRLTRRIKPFLLRRSKELVAADLPPKQEQVLDVELSPRHRTLYDAHHARERQKILGLVDDDFDGNRVEILAALTRLRQLALDPVLVEEGAGAVGSAKIDLLVDHLHELAAEGHRALVFSQFTGFLGRVRERLDAEGLAHAYLDGRTRDRGAVVEAFRTGDAPVFLISLKAGGVGLTLTEADYVFVLDPWWNPAAEAQAVDRAHRIGQSRTVLVYRLVAADTIEEKVMALKARKAALFAQVLDGSAGLAESISADDIRGLFD